MKMQIILVQVKVNLKLGIIITKSYSHRIDEISIDLSSRGGSRTAATSKVELFLIIVNRWKPLTIITKSSTLDVAAVLDPSLFK